MIKNQHVAQKGSIECKCIEITYVYLNNKHNVDSTFTYTEPSQQ